MRLLNLEPEETVHVRCLLVHGEIPETGSEGITVTTNDANDIEHFPAQVWPAYGGQFKALLMLEPGCNKVTFSYKSQALRWGASHSITVNYVPLLQYPPLHLAILVARDSPLFMDCPSAKTAAAGGMPGAHADLQAAIAKFRMTAYMWQAILAEQFREMGLGRRSFRLDEQWDADTVSRHFLTAGADASPAERRVRSTAKVHVVKSEKNVTEIRSHCPQNHYFHVPELWKVFANELDNYGTPFLPQAEPVAAGLIFDSHIQQGQDDNYYSMGHVPCGFHQPQNLLPFSLAMHGSSYTFSWPRFLEEVPSSLTDEQSGMFRIPGAKIEAGKQPVGSDAAWLACAASQMGFLDSVEVMLARQEPDRDRLRLPVLKQYNCWPSDFLSHPGIDKREDGAILARYGQNAADFLLQRLQRFLCMKGSPLLRLPSDGVVAKQAESPPSPIFVHNKLDLESFEAGADLRIASPVGVAYISFNGEQEDNVNVHDPRNSIVYTKDELEARFPVSAELKLRVLLMDGSLHYTSVWDLFKRSQPLRVPGTAIQLSKESVLADDFVPKNDPHVKRWHWAAALWKRGADGKIIPATRMEICNGCVLDGARIHYEDGSVVNCGPVYGMSGEDHHISGHLTEGIDLPDGNNKISEIVLRKSYCLEGLGLRLPDGSILGRRVPHQDVTLAAGPDRRIVGFYGSHYWNQPHATLEFGIITVDKDVELPDSTWDMPELQNTDGGQGPRPGVYRGQGSRSGIYDEEEVTEPWYTE